MFTVFESSNQMTVWLGRRGKSWHNDSHRYVFVTGCPRVEDCGPAGEPLSRISRRYSCVTVNTGRVSRNNTAAAELQTSDEKKKKGVSSRLLFVYYMEISLRGVQEARLNIRSDCHLHVRSCRIPLSFVVLWTEDCFLFLCIAIRFDIGFIAVICSLLYEIQTLMGF